MNSNRISQEIQIPLTVMNQVLDELRAANEKFERVVELGHSVQGVQKAIKDLAAKVDQLIDAVHSGENNLSTRVAIIEERMRQHETGWQKWAQVIGSMCGALALIVAAFIQYGAK